MYQVHFVTLNNYFIFSFNVFFVSQIRTEILKLLYL